MSLYGVNLAKGVVADAARRRKQYFAMIVYFGLCGALMIEGGLRISQRQTRASEARVEVARMEESFKATHPSASGLKSYVDELVVRLSSQKRKILALKRELPDEVPLAQVLFYLMKPVPATGKLLSFDYNKESRCVDVACQLLVGEQGTLSPNALLQEWRSDEELFGYVSEIRLLHLEENQFVKGRPAVVLNSRIELY